MEAAGLFNDERSKRLKIANDLDRALLRQSERKGNFVPAALLGGGVRNALARPGITSLLNTRTEDHAALVSSSSLRPSTMPDNPLAEALRAQQLPSSQGNVESALERQRLVNQLEAANTLRARQLHQQHQLQGSDDVLQAAIERQRLVHQLETAAAVQRLQRLREQELELQVLQNQRERIARAEQLARFPDFSSLLRSDRLLPLQANPLSLLGTSRVQQDGGALQELALSATLQQRLPQADASQYASLDASSASASSNKRPFDVYAVAEGSGQQTDQIDEVTEKHLSPYQAQCWDEHFKELLKYRERTGHCNVPQHTHLENPKLARWVKRQRYQYKLRNEGKPSNMTRERMLALERIGFVWDSHSAVWDERFHELQGFHRLFNHCNVPTTYAANRKLAAWVKCQRRQYKLLKDGQPSNMDEERLRKLEALGFEWQLRSYHVVRNKKAGENDDDEESNASE